MIIEVLKSPFNSPFYKGGKWGNQMFAGLPPLFKGGPGGFLTYHHQRLLHLLPVSAAVGQGRDEDGVVMISYA